MPCCRVRKVLVPKRLETSEIVEIKFKRTLNKPGQPEKAL